MNKAVRAKIQEITTPGMMPAEVIEILSRQGYDPSAVIRELGEMVGEEVHPENRRQPSLEELDELRRLRQRLARYFGP